MAVRKPNETAGVRKLGRGDYRIVTNIDGDHARFFQTDRVYAGASSVFGALTARLIMRSHAKFNRALAAEVARRSTVSS